MPRKQPVIRTVSYGYSKEDGSLIPFDDLTVEQKTKAATELKLQYMRAYFPGVEFSVAESGSKEGKRGEQYAG